MKILRVIKWRMDELFFASARLLFRQRKGGGVILLVRTDGIGDFVFFSRYLSSLRKAFVGHKLALVCRTETAELAGKIHALDAVIGFRSLAYRWNYLYRLYVLHTIRSLRPDVAIYCTYHRMHVGDEMTLLSGAGRTIAMSGNNESIDLASKQRNDRLYSKIVEVPDHTSEAVKYSELFSAIGIQVRPSLFGELFSDEGTTKRRVILNCAVVAPGGSAAIRRWAPEKFAELSDSIAKEYGMNIVLCGSQRESGILGSIRRQMSSRAVVFDSLSLNEALTLLRDADLFVGNDSGLLHMATSLGTPSVGIVGGGHFSRYFPYGVREVIVHHKLDCFECNWHCPFEEPFCLTRIEVEDVLVGIRSVMGYTRAVNR